MKFALSFLALVIIMLTSCQKEISGDILNGGGGGGNTTTGLLIKTVQKTGQDSLVTTYTYNSNKKITGLTQTGTDEQGNVVNREYRYYRNSSGIITSYTGIDADLVSAGVDSVSVIVHYNSSTSRYTSNVLNLTASGLTLLDSSAFVYDGTGKIIAENAYESPSGNGSDYYLSGKIDYTYDASGNITQLEIHDLDISGAEIFTATTKLNYDTRNNPLHFGMEGFAVGHQEWASPNNISSEALSDSNGPADDQILSIIFTYNSNSEPATGQTTVMPDNIIFNTSYFYQ